MNAKIKDLSSIQIIYMVGWIDDINFIYSKLNISTIIIQLSFIIYFITVFLHVWIYFIKRMQY
jgi:hypothetical protein